MIKTRTQKTVEYPPCNSCGNKKYSIKWKKVTTWEHKGSFQIVSCPKCGLVYLCPRPTRRHIGKYYPSESYWGKNIIAKYKASSEWKRKRDYEYGFLYDKILSIKKKGAILDIGAGIGTFLSKFKELHWKVAGVELSPDAVKLSQTLFKINLKPGDFLDLKYPKKQYDVVTLNNALEHLYDPKKTLEAVYETLRDDGLLVIVVPNIESLGAWIFSQRWYALQPPRHFYHFSERSLRKLLNDTGFSVTSVSHNYWVHNHYSLFENLRLRFSPKFKQKKQGGLVAPALLAPTPFSFKKELGKAIFKSLAVMLTITGIAIRRGELITVLAQKSQRS